ncbi:MAG: hypothetical protein EOP56_03870 [Sphingobacteriales bacterium]|nr:MAG: hypothetical protein EOP56_03870 [Sphingobacteriales bacterium]
MYENKTGAVKYGTVLKILAFAIMIIGVGLRLMVYLQNRNLILDEANVARNIFERGFSALVKPLSYEQYAPPIFLWILKLSAALFGYSEQVLRLYPIIAGIVALFLLYKVGKEIGGLRAVWYPLILFALAPILIRYSSELKQYVPDACITLLLVWAALRIDIVKTTTVRFIVSWVVIGSLAIWASMPSVFVLAGVGCYYGVICLQHKDYKRLLTIVVTSVLWVVQFSIYYFTILKPQISSSYLQNFHHYDFLFATPETSGEWMHNWVVFSRLIKQFSKAEFFVQVNAWLMLLGIIMLLWKSPARGVLLFVPIGAVMIAAAFNQYSLLPRVALFTLPVLLLLILYGLSFLLYRRSILINVAILLLVLPCVYLSISNGRTEVYKYEQLTEGLDYLNRKQITGPYTYIHHASGPAFIYYTQIHPRRNDLKQFDETAILPWYVNYDSLAWQMRYVWKNEKPVAFIYTNTSAEELAKRKNWLDNRIEEVGRLDREYIRVYVYDPKP